MRAYLSAEGGEAALLATMGTLSPVYQHTPTVQ